MDFAARYDLLKTIVARYDGYYHLAAVKASLLLTTNVILLAAVVSEESGLHDALAGGGVARGLLAMATGLSLVSIGFAVLVVASYLASGRRNRDRASVVYSGSVAATSAGDYLERLRTIDEAAVIDDLAGLAHGLATGLARKFRRINASLVAFLGAILLAVAGYLLAGTG